MNDMNGQAQGIDLSSVRILTPIETSNALLQVYNTLGAISLPVAQADKLIQARAVIAAVNNSIVASAQQQAMPPVIPAELQGDVNGSNNV